MLVSVSAIYVFILQQKSFGKLIAQRYISAIKLLINKYISEILIQIEIICHSYKKNIYLILIFFGSSL